MTLGIPSWTVRHFFFWPMASRKPHRAVSGETESQHALTGRADFNLAPSAAAGRVEFEQEFHATTENVGCYGETSRAGCTSIQFMGFNHSNTLTALWNRLNHRAYEDGCHYMFMPNDDLRMYTQGWSETLISALWGSDLYPNLGVTGPVDPVSGRGDMSSMPMISRSFVPNPKPYPHRCLSSSSSADLCASCASYIGDGGARVHLDIFGSSNSLPLVFQNWYNDVWLGNVYRPFR